MALVPAGTFLMGSNDHYPEERPVRPATVGAFLMDRTPVTNDQFARFVAATGHVTFAEIAPDPRDYPGMDPALAMPGSIVFVPPSRPVRLADGPGWWNFILGADWRHPAGPGSGIDHIPDHPVVHIGYTDALAYAAWAGKQLPTEREWERAARGGLEGAAYAWGDDFTPGGRRMAKTWKGDFPHRNAAPPGLERTAPVGSYPANGFGLFDMIGNVWEWTDEVAAARGEKGCCAGLAAAEKGGPQERVLKGGSHMCAPEYCQRYRPAARWLQPVDTTTSHVGFRCIRRLDA
ncbi:MAG: formylglycine-generating enzyme family protein [Sphingobium sp.]